MGDVEKLSPGELSDFLDIFQNLSGNGTAYEDCCPVGQVCDLTDSQEFEATFIVVLYSLTFVVGVLGNVLLLGVLVQSRRTWSVTDTFILHLALTDVLLLVTLPMWAAQAAQADGWTFGTPLCKITGSINFYCGIFLLGCISLDRYLSIVHATQMYSRRKPWVVHTSCLVAWLFSLLLSISDMIFLEAVVDNRQKTTKYGPKQQSRWWLASRLTYHLVGFLLPSAVMVFCYSGILRRLRCGSQGLQKQRAIRVIVTVVAVFFLCWTPYNITLMVDTLQSSRSNTECGMKMSLGKAMTVTSTVGYLHCSLNPILYAFVGVKFRRQLLALLSALGCRVKTSRLQSTVSSRRSSIWSESAETSTVAV
uniref:C-X-C chemokine receptor type 3 n=1 Tax=Takifugu rubripes TaxID=31033 RepID=A0A674PCJ7_TAKRU